MPSWRMFVARCLPFANPRMAVEVRKAEVRMQWGTVESTLVGTYQVDLATLLDAPVVEMTSDQPALGRGRSLQSLRQSMRWRYGSNFRRFARNSIAHGTDQLAAIHEHQELDERYRFLTTQEQDLSTSIGSLKEIIQRINRTTKDMFTGTFTELQQKFS